MVDNEMYQALMEGRMPLRVDLEKDGDQWVAKHDQYGITVEARDDSPRMAQEAIRTLVMDRVRRGDFEVRFG